MNVNNVAATEKVERECDADSDDTYFSDAEIKVKSQAGEVETLKLIDHKCNSDTKNGPMPSQTIESNVVKNTDGKSVIVSKNVEEQSESLNLVAKKCVRLQKARPEYNGITGFDKKKPRSLKRLELLEQHRKKMKNHGKTLTKRLCTIRNDVKMWLNGNRLKISKRNCIALYKDVKAIKNILAQLYKASIRLTNYIGGDMPFTHKRYSAANQICETLLIQLNPAMYENISLVTRSFTKERFISSDEDYSDSENSQNSDHTIVDKEREGKLIVREINNDLAMSQANNINATSNLTSSLTPNDNQTTSPTNQSIDHNKLHYTVIKDPNTGKCFPEVTENSNFDDVEIIDLCEENLSTSPELINMEVLQLHINETDNLPTKNFISNKISIPNIMPTVNEHNVVELSEPKETRNELVTSLAQLSMDSIHKNEIDKTQAKNSYMSNLEIQVTEELRLNCIDFDDFSHEETMEIESSNSVNKLIDLKGTNILKNDSETGQEWNKCLAPKSMAMRKEEMRTVSMEKNNCNINFSENENPCVPSWCYIFEQHKIKNSLPTLIELMLAGLIHPGEKVLTIKENGIQGSLLKNGKITNPDGATFQSPMVWCSAWSNGKSVSRNMAYQKVHYKGVPLIEVCQNAFEVALKKIYEVNMEKQTCQLTTESDLETGHSVTELQNHLSESHIVEDIKDKESYKDPILSIEAVAFHSPNEFQVDEVFGCLFHREGKFTGDLEFIDKW